jgi:thymidylate kinase
MRQVSNKGKIDHSPTVIEFFGLPGAGKTTIANELVQALREHGYDALTATDFIRWLSAQPRLRKLGFLVADLQALCRQLFWCTLFSFTLHPLRGISPSKTGRVPYINLCFERYLDSLGDSVVVMDQANVQLIWSVAAFSSRYNKRLLFRVSRETLGARARRFVCLTPNVEETSQRLQARATSQGRFDVLEEQRVGDALDNASRIVEDLKSALKRDQRVVTEINATLPPDKNAEGLLAQILQELPQRDQR